MPKKWMPIRPHEYPTHDLLGRIPEFDERSREFPIRKLLAPEQLAIPRGKTWRIPILLDQANTTACVGNAAVYDLAAYPVPLVKPNGLPFDEEYAQLVYHLAQKYDEWEGEDYDGSSTLGGAKALKALGYIGAYHWAFNIGEVYAALAYLGPVIVGTDWLASMFEPINENGLLEVDPDSSLEGGHDYCFRGIIISESYKAELVGSRHNRQGIPLLRFRQSWGDWGHEGDGLMWGDDLAMLLKGTPNGYPGDARVTTTPFHR